MNGFELMADSYRKAAEQGEIDKEYSEKECKVLDFLAGCDNADICNLFDSSAFTDIVKAYLKMAVGELVDEGTIDERQAQAIRDRFSSLFDRKKACEVI